MAFFGSSGPPSQQSVDRRRKIAQALALAGQQGLQGSGQGRSFRAPSTGATIAGALSSLIGGYQAGKAEYEQGSVTEDRKRQIAEALAKVQGGGEQNKAAFEALKTLPLEQQEAALSKGVTDKLFTKPVRERVDLGDKIGIVDETGKVVGELPKGASPDSALSSETTRRGQDLSAATTTRGQDLTAATTSRGQDITMRGQDLTATTAARGQDVTMRGQDLTATTAARTQANKPLPEYQSKAVGQLNRMQGAEQELQSLMAEGFKPGYTDKGADAIPGVGNSMVSGDYQRYKQAANEFIAGILRLDSGAAVPEVEFDRYFKTYFPQPGDSDEVVAQKAESRQRAVDSLKLGLGDAAGLVPQPQAPSQPNEFRNGNSPARTRTQAAEPFMGRYLPK